MVNTGERGGGGEEGGEGGGEGRTGEGEGGESTYKKHNH